MNWSLALSDNPRKIEVFSFVAPEEHSSSSVRSPSYASPQIAAAPSKIHQQVIFIKPPETKVAPHQYATQNYAPSATEQKTHIYVLTPEPSHTHNVRHSQHSQPSYQNINHKPEVKFITYHNPGQAEQIQAQIIQQYGGNPSAVIAG